MLGLLPVDDNHSAAGPVLGTLYNEPAPLQHSLTLPVTTASLASIMDPINIRSDSSAATSDEATPVPAQSQHSVATAEDTFHHADLPPAITDPGLYASVFGEFLENDPKLYGPLFGSDWEP